jgi:hypothetical protein
VSMARRMGAEMGIADVVKRIMGHEGPRTEEKWRRRGTRCSRGRSSIIAATFLVIMGPLGRGGCGANDSCEVRWRFRIGKVGGNDSNEEKNRMNMTVAATCGTRRCKAEMNIG